MLLGGRVAQSSCRTCKQLKFEHRGRRTEIVPIRCACDKPKPAEEVDIEAMRAAKLQKTAQKSRTGNMAALDPTGQGTKESFARKVLPTVSRGLRETVSYRNRAFVFPDFGMKRCVHRRRGPQKRPL